MSAGLWLDVPLTKRACFLCFFMFHFVANLLSKTTKSIISTATLLQFD